jgi:colicin import membrane protein
MLPGTEKRKARNSAKVNLVLSLAFHSLLVFAVFYFAAREGLLGDKMHTIAVSMEPEKKPEPKPPVKPKEPEPSKADAPKPVETAKITETPKMTIQAPPPAAATAASPAFAPPPAEVPDFAFEGGKNVVSSSDPVELFKGVIQSTLQFNWDRPKDTDDHTNVAEVEITVSKQGEITSPVWKKKSGQKQWDDSVLLAIANTKKVSRPPPSNFPSRVVIRFDVQPLSPVGE